MKNLRKAAQGRECQVRIPNICSGNRETVVLAHLNNKRLFGVGTGQKVPDLFGSWACQACHDCLDGRQSTYGVFTDAELKAMHMEAVFRTMNVLLTEGKIQKGV